MSKGHSSRMAPGTFKELKEARHAGAEKGRETVAGQSDRDRIMWGPRGHVKHSGLYSKVLEVSRMV